MGVKKWVVPLKKISSQSWDENGIKMSEKFTF